MGNFEKLSVLVIVVIIVMILVVALYTWTDNPDHASGAQTMAAVGPEPTPQPPVNPAVDGPGMGGIVVPALTQKQGEKQGEQKTCAQLIVEANPPKPAPDGTAPAPTPPAPPPPAEPKTHVVQAGETPSRIAKMYYPQSPVKGLAAIHTANPGMSDTSLRVGSKLVIPELTAEGTAAVVQPTNGTTATPTPKPMATTIQRGGTYVVRRGDTLVKISKGAYGTTDRWQDIWLANFDAIDDVDHPAAGTRLKIPR
jgi:nucleoid-associated protein YgaU